MYQLDIQKNDQIKHEIYNIMNNHTEDVSKDGIFNQVHFLFSSYPSWYL